MEAPSIWVRKLAHWLPAHRDRLTLLFTRAIGAAFSGDFTPEFQPGPDEPAKSKDPETVKAAANRELDRFSRRADGAIAAYKAHKRSR